ncbi:hypothetical protein AI2994V1_2196 [Escherichia coli]|nr:hypothetical protein AI2994V1_2196 [Escherichia coli]
MWIKKSPSCLNGGGNVRDHISLYFYGGYRNLCYLMFFDKAITCSKNNLNTENSCVINNWIFILMKIIISKFISLLSYKKPHTDMLSVWGNRIIESKKRL